MANARDFEVVLSPNMGTSSPVLVEVGNATHVTLYGKREASYDPTGNVGYWTKLADGSFIGQDLALSFVSPKTAIANRPGVFGYPEFVVDAPRGFATQGYEAGSLQTILSSYSTEDNGYGTVFLKWTGRVWAPLGGTGIYIG